MVEAGGSDGIGLLEREGPLATAEAVVAGALGGQGGALVLDGPAGIGKTRLLDAAAHRAEVAGARVLRSRGDELEQGFAWGVVLQLFGPLAGDLDLRGAAHLARPIFDWTGPRTTSGGDLFPILHGLHWLTLDLAEQRPLTLVVDDAHWCDLQSLRFLDYLVRRSDGLAVAVLAGVRSGDPVEADIDDVLSRLRAEDGVRTEALAGLSDAAIATLVRAELPAATPGFCAALADAVGGNPFLGLELSRAVRAEGIDPEDHAAERLDDLRPPGVRHALLVRLGRLGPAASGLAAAIAVLGPHATLRRAAALADLGPPDDVEALDALAAAAILDPEPLDFVHPLLRSTVYDDLGPARSRRLHLAAARLLDADGAGPAEITPHLLRGEPCGEGWAVAALLAAAEDALDQGAPERAAALARAGLAAHPPPPARAGLLLVRGRAEAEQGVEDAGVTLGTALDLLPSTVEPRAALDLGQALYVCGRFDAAAEAFARGRDAVTARGAGEDEVVASLLAAGAVMSSILSTRPLPALSEGLASGGPVPVAPDLAERAELAVAAGRLAVGVDLPPAPAASGGPRCERVLALVDGALRGEPLPPELGTVVLEPLALALTLCDHFDRATDLLDRALAWATERGRAATHAALLPLRGFAGLGRGDLAGAAADGEDGIRLAGESGAGHRTVAAARYVLAVASLERGDLERAREAVAVPWDTAVDRWGGSPLLGWYLDAVGRVALAEGRPDAALDALEAAGEHYAAAGGPGAYGQWRSVASQAAVAAGRRSSAERLAADAVAHARAGGSARATAAGLRAQALLADTDDERLSLLHEALETLAGSEAVLERAAVEVDLGAALRRGGQRGDARPPLRRGLDVARRCGARVLAERAAVELEATGARRPRLALTGVESLTPSERRVAQLAADGRSNREIAESLFVTRKTVEVHLSATYRKLGVRGREELPATLS